MEIVVYSKGITGGQVHLPPSKSVAHRALICAALSGGRCRVSPIDSSADMEATFHFIRAMGGQVTYENRCTTIDAGEGASDYVNCMESGSTLRFIIPILAALGRSTTFTGCGRLPNRPIGIYSEILRGVKTVGEGLPYSISGQLQSGEFSLPGNISSQFITGLLLALPLLAGDSTIILTTPLESESYVNITLEVMAAFGVHARQTAEGYFVPGGQKYSPRDYTVEADWSQAAFFLSMGAFSEQPVELLGLNPHSLQGDKACLEVFREMGLCIQTEEQRFIVQRPKNRVLPVRVDVRNIPDAVPAIAVTAALAEGTTYITGAARLRIKECDRLMAVTNAINSLGGKVTELPDGLAIQGVERLQGGTAQGCNDHRIVMCLAAARGAAAGDVIVTDPNSIRKSYPDFYRDYVNLGGEANVLDMG